MLTGEDVLPEKDLLEKAVALKRFEYVPLDKEVKPRTSVAENQSQRLIKFISLMKKKNQKWKSIMNQI